MKKVEIDYQEKEKRYPDSLSIDVYLKEIGVYSLRKSDEEIELVKRMNKGDEEARQKLITSNLRFVVYVAKQYQNQGLSLEDLINEGNCGLIKGIDRYDVTKGYKVISYAVWWIRQSILAALAEYSRTVRLPLNQHVNVRRELRDDLVFESLDEIYINDDSYFKKEIGVKDSEVRLGNETEQFRKIIRKYLTEREIYIIKEYFGIGGEVPKTHDRIGNEIGLTGEMVRTIKKKALKKLSKKQELKPFIEFFC